MTINLRRVFILAALLVALGSCTITTEGIQKHDVPLPEVFPPSKTVASYRRLKEPFKVASTNLDSEVGGTEKMEILHKWGVIQAMSAEYGIPDRPLAARITVIELRTKPNA